MMTACGSLAYSAPEMLLQEPYDGPSVDVWSLGLYALQLCLLLIGPGIIVYMMIVGHLPFQDHNESSTVFKILDVNYTLPDYVTPGFRDLITKILVRFEDQVFCPCLI
jgi:serine/threonine protein kinase